MLLRIAHMEHLGDPLPYALSEVNFATSHILYSRWGLGWDDGAERATSIRVQRAGIDGIPSH